MRGASWGPRNVSAPLDRAPRPGAEREQEVVVGDRLAVLRDDLVRVGVDGRQRVAHDGEAAVLGDGGKLVARGMAEPERLADREGPIGEVAIGRQQGHPYAIAGQFAQRQRRFERGDTAADDEDTSVRRSWCLDGMRRRGIRHRGFYGVGRGASPVVAGAPDCDAL